jgi:hypothetical protein
MKQSTLFSIGMFILAAALHVAGFQEMGWSWLWLLLANVGFGFIAGAGLGIWLVAISKEDWLFPMSYAITMALPLFTGQFFEMTAYSWAAIMLLQGVAVVSSVMNRMVFQQAMARLSAGL